MIKTCNICWKCPGHPRLKINDGRGAKRIIEAGINVMGPKFCKSHSVPELKDKLQPDEICAANVRVFRGDIFYHKNFVLKMC